jgi:hypothetical protein
MQILKFLYLWLAILVFLEWYSRNYPAGTPPEGPRPAAAATAGKRGTGAGEGIPRPVAPHERGFMRLERASPAAGLAQGPAADDSGRR